MGFWDQAGFGPEAVAMADQQDMQAKAMLDQTIDELIKSRHSEGVQTPVALRAFFLDAQMSAETQEAVDLRKLLSYVFVTAVERLADIKEGKTDGLLEEG